MLMRGKSSPYGRPVTGLIDAGPVDPRHPPMTLRVNARRGTAAAYVQRLASLGRGATAIGYFTHVWKPSYRQFGVPEENRRALRRINDQITRLAPALLADPARREVAIEATGGAKIDVMAREHEGSLYLFAVNYDERQVTSEVTISLPGLSAGTEVVAVDEGRTIAAAAGSFTDAFDPLAVHIYRIDGP